jgi:MFS family permease
MHPSINTTHTKFIDTGIATGSAATHAYLSDTTSPANRSGVFSLMLGLLFCGIALGPTLGGLLISETGDLLSVFYIAAALHVVYLFMALFVVPESLTKEAALENAEVARMKAEQDAILLAKQEENMTPARKRIHRILRTAFFFLSPLDIFVPHNVEGSRRREWNLTAVAISYGLVVLLMVKLVFFHAELPSDIHHRVRISSNSNTPVMSSDGARRNWDIG